MSFSIWKSLDPHSSPLSLELGWKGQRMSSKALSISSILHDWWSRPLNLKIWWQSKPKSGDNQSKNQVTIKACLIRTTWQCRSRHRLRVRQRSLLTWRARDRPANWEQSVKINKLEERTLKLKRGEHLSKVILVSMDDHGASYNGVLPREGQEGVSDVNLLKQNLCRVMMTMTMTWRWWWSSSASSWS